MRVVLGNCWLQDQDLLRNRQHIDKLMIHLEMSSCCSNNWSEFLISRLAQAWQSNKINLQWKLHSHSSQMISLKTTRGGSFPASYSCPYQNIAVPVMLQVWMPAKKTLLICWGTRRSQILWWCFASAPEPCLFHQLLEGFTARKSHQLCFERAMEGFNLKRKSQLSHICNHDSTFLALTFGLSEQRRAVFGSR